MHMMEEIDLESRDKRHSQQQSLLSPNDPARPENTHSPLSPAFSTQSYQPLMQKEQEKTEYHNNFHNDIEDQGTPRPNQTRFESDVHERAYSGGVSADRRMKKSIRILRFFHRFATFALAVVTMTLLCITVHAYLTSRDARATIYSGVGGEVRRGPWHNPTKTWPTYLLLANAVTSVFFGLISMLGYVYGGVAWANKMTDLGGADFYFGFWILHSIVWLVTTVLYRQQRKVADLWGWSCSPQAHAIQGVFRDVVDFDYLCRIQETTAVVGFMTTALLVLQAIIYIMVFFRLQNSRALGKYFPEHYEHREAKWQSTWVRRSGTGIGWKEEVKKQNSREGVNAPDANGGIYDKQQDGDEGVIR